MLKRSKFLKIAFPIFIVFLGHVKKNTNRVNLCQNRVFANCRDVKNEVFERKLHFLFLSSYVTVRETEKNKN